MFGDPNALLNDVGAELLNREGANVAEELTDDSIAESVVVQVENVLHDIVAIGILNQSEGVVCDFGHELNPLCI